MVPLEEGTEGRSSPGTRRQAETETDEAELTACTLFSRGDHVNWFEQPHYPVSRTQTARMDVHVYFPYDLPIDSSLLDNFQPKETDKQTPGNSMEETFHS